MTKKSEKLLERHDALINEPIHTTAVYTYDDAVVLTKSSYDTICRAVLSVRFPNHIALPPRHLALAMLRTSLSVSLA
jgi:hypothetical protein